jgi:hypothetical protein
MTVDIFEEVVTLLNIFCGNRHTATTFFLSKTVSPQTIANVQDTGSNQQYFSIRNSGGVTISRKKSLAAS